MSAYSLVWNFPIKYFFNFFKNLWEKFSTKLNATSKKTPLNHSKIDKISIFERFWGVFKPTKLLTRSLVVTIDHSYSDLIDRLNGWKIFNFSIRTIIFFKKSMKIFQIFELFEKNDKKSSFLSIDDFFIKIDCINFYQKSTIFDKNHDFWQKFDDSFFVPQKSSIFGQKSRFFWGGVLASKKVVFWTTFLGPKIVDFWPFLDPQKCAKIAIPRPPPRSSEKWSKITGNQKDFFRLFSTFFSDFWPFLTKIRSGAFFGPFFEGLRTLKNRRKFVKKWHFFRSSIFIDFLIKNWWKNQFFDQNRKKWQFL